MGRFTTRIPKERTRFRGQTVPFAPFARGLFPAPVLGPEATHGKSRAACIRSGKGGPGRLRHVTFAIVRNVTDTTLPTIASNPLRGTPRGRPVRHGRKRINKISAVNHCVVPTIRSRGDDKAMTWSYARHRPMSLSNECDDGYFSMLSDVLGNPLFVGWCGGFCFFAKASAVQWLKRIRIGVALGHPAQQ